MNKQQYCQKLDCMKEVYDGLPYCYDCRDTEVEIQ